MILLVLFVFSVTVTAAILCMSAWSDVRSMTIPNSYSIIVVACFAVAYGAAFVAGHGGVFSVWWSHLLSALVMFGLTFVLFLTGSFGAGDSKLATALGFWTGLSGLPVFLFFTTMAGAVLGIAALILRRWPLWGGAPEGSWANRAQGGDNAVPYGVAIACGAIIAFFTLGYPDPELLKGFVGEGLVE